MCGIAGIVSATPCCAGPHLAALCDAMAHRGPDDWGYAQTRATAGGGAADAMTRHRLPPTTPGTVFLGHRRLSIIDPTGSRQPLASADGTVWVSFNGEIYNYPELRRALQAKRYPLREQGDTETLVYLWQEHGPEMVQHLRGMFAFALYDHRKHLLFLARDRFGQKPLYFCATPERFVFASELGALRRSRQIPDDTDPAAVAEYFRYGYIPSPYTIYRSVRALRPGHCATLDTKTLTFAEREYWRPRVRADSGTDIRELPARLQEAVTLRLRADVPLGVFLSGGIDSSLIAAAMVDGAREAVRSFTVTTRGHDCDEAGTAAATAAALGTQHTELPVEADFVGVAQQLAGHFGQPFADYSAIPTYAVSQGTRQHVKVALGGDGADEIFAGYERYLNGGRKSLVGRLPACLRAGLAACCRPFAPHVPLAQHLPDFLLSAGPLNRSGENLTSMFHCAWRRRAFQPDFVQALDGAHGRCAAFISAFAEGASEAPLQRWLETDQRRYLCDDILTKVDIASMAVSLECRAPFLDHRFVEWANTLPLAQKLAGGVTKVALRNLARARLGSKLAALPKKGFTLPLAAWMRTDLRDWTREQIDASRAAWSPYLRPAVVEALWQDHQTCHADHSMKLWLIAAFALWEQAR